MILASFYPGADRLLREAQRTESGYRVFSPQIVEQLKFIRKAQELGFSLDEIRELLVLRDRSTSAALTSNRSLKKSWRAFAGSCENSMPWRRI